MSSNSEHPEFAGMTVNERLFVSGLMPKWDDACRRRDRDAMIALLEKVEISQAASTVQTILANPDVYLKHLGPAK
jgi:hypothetical protein